LLHEIKRVSGNESRNAKHNDKFQTTAKLTGCDRAGRRGHIAVSITYILSDHTKYLLDATVIGHRGDGLSIQE
jgi:hypothetical protein